LEGQDIGPQEYELLTKDGSRISCEVHSNVLRNEEGTPFGFVRVCRNIAERRHAEDVALKEYKFSRAVIDSLSAPFFMYDFVNRRFFRWNSAFSALSGYSDGEIARMKLIDFVRESDQGILIGMLDEFKRQGHVSFEMPVLSKDGKVTLCLLSGTLLHYEGNDYVVGMGIDITDRKNAEQEVRQSEHMYRLLADHMKDAVWIMDFNLKVTYVSPSAEKLLGWTQEKIKKLALDKLLTPESFKAATDFYAEELPRALAAPPDYGLERTLELEFVRNDGQTLWGECMFSLMRDENGTPVSILGESRNITERKQMEHRLQISESNFRRSLDESPLGVRITSAEGETVYANKTILDIYGYSTTEELQNTPLKERYTPESLAACMERRKNRKNGRPAPQEYEVSIVRKDGEVRHLHVFRKEIFWDAKKYYQVIYNDITERRRAETELQKTQDLYRLLADNINDAIWIMDFKLNLLYVSPSVEKLYGYTLEEVKTLKLKKLFTPDSYHKVTEAYAVELSSAMAIKSPPPGTRHVMELEAYHKDGRKIWIENRVSLIRDEHGKPLSILGETKDITERKQAQELLKKSEEQYRLLADHMKDQVWLMDLNMQITYISPSVERLLGYASDEIKTMSIDKLLTPDSLNKAMNFTSISMPKAMKQSSKDYIFRTLDLEFVSKSGRTLWGECSFSFIRDDNGNVISIL
ncbi:MAG: PAS domain S-box protein, partial [Candidatus Aenigmarchaeota archaeon]|nr:PAS domain S-box protein [Candidatus Aenigmarchaeota archaeon]